MKDDFITIENLDSKVRAPIKKNISVTRTEYYLKTLCERTFLSLWSYPCVYRDQGDGKEVCDLIVVFQNHIIIFSDKDCAFPDTDNLNNDWNKWYKRTIAESAKQIWGAERWIKEFPKRLFLDHKCQKPFPIELPDPTNAIFHRIVVAHSCKERCQKEMKGGSGSLILCSDIKGDMHYVSESNDGKPFWIGQIDPSKGFIHILDDTSLDIVMQALDTVSDFTAYLTKKEHFLSNYSVCAAGEEELLAYYLKNVNKLGDHDFVFENASSIVIDEGTWNDFQNKPQRKAQIAENNISYIWDRLIETFNQQILNNTLHNAFPIGVNNNEKVMRIMAAENRLRRRILSKALHDFLDKHVPKYDRAIRVFNSGKQEYPFYVFLLLTPPDPFKQDSIEYKKYRETRCNFLEACCKVAKSQFPHAEDIIGIATEPKNDIGSSEDLLYLDAHHWTEEQQREAVELQEKLDILNNTEITKYEANEYPNVDTNIYKTNIPMKGRERNSPCPCGSGKKFKKCCGAI